MRTKPIALMIIHSLLILSSGRGAVSWRGVAKESNLDTLIEHGKRDLSRFDFSNAEKILQKAVNLDPTSATAHRLLAQALIGQLPPSLHLFPDTSHLLLKAEIAGFGGATAPISYGRSRVSGWASLVESRIPRPCDSCRADTGRRSTTGSLNAGSNKGKSKLFASDAAMSGLLRESPVTGHRSRVSG